MTVSPFLGIAGAVPAEGPDAGMVAHYGNPSVEQRRLVAGTAVVDLSARALVTVTGEDRLTWLNSMSSQRIDRLNPGESAETLFLDPNGRLEHAAGVLDDGIRTWLLVEHADAESLVSYLNKMRFMLRVEVADVSADFARVGLFAADQKNDDAETESGLHVPLALPAEVSNGHALVWRDPWRDLVPGGVQYADDAEHPAAEWKWVEVIVPRGALAEIVARVNSRNLFVAGLLAEEALRIAAWRPRFATEVDERTIPHELDWLRSAVHLNKGCYRGQETVAKVHNLGHPPRRLVMLHLDGSDSVLPIRGDAVLSGPDDARTPVGEITSAGIHHELGPIALAVIKRRTDAAAVLVVASHDTVISAAQVVVVPADAGAAVDVPRLPRLGAVTRPSR